jgi:hypothetical protein
LRSKIRKSPEQRLRTQGCTVIASQLLMATLTATEAIGSGSDEHAEHFIVGDKVSSNLGTWWLHMILYWYPA